MNLWMKVVGGGGSNWCGDDRDDTSWQMTDWQTLKNVTVSKEELNKVISVFQECTRKQMIRTYDYNLNLDFLTHVF